MKNKIIFVACDTSNLNQTKKILKNINTKKLKMIPKFGLQFFYSKNGRNFLEKFTDIILNEIKRALRRGDGVELRNFGTFRVKTQKASIRRNPKTNEKVAVPEKKVISWKMSKEMFKKINNEE